MQQSNERIPSLDGLRGISILLVVVGHLAGTKGFPFSAQQMHAAAAASLGVRVFFVLSGFLITRLLLIEQASKGTVKLSTFYFRRTLRIIVPYYAFLLAVWGLAQLGAVSLQPSDLFHAVTYTSNYHQDHAWTLGHTWSLSVEEQFYLLWPALLLLLGPKRALWLAGAYVLAAPAGRLYVWFFQPSLREGIGHTFGTVADAIAAGCVLAGAREWLWRRPIVRTLLGSRVFAVVPVGVVAACALDQHPMLAFTVGWLAMDIGVALSVEYCLRFPARPLPRLLSTRPLVALGTLSYSIYLWQQLPINRSQTSLWTSFPVNLLLACGLAVAAYFLVEKPSLWLRKRLEQKRREVAHPILTPMLQRASNG